MRAQGVDLAGIAGQVPLDVVGLCRRLRAAGHQAWLVGGAVRDLLLGRPAHDFDVATSARPEQVVDVFGRRSTLPTGMQHGTVTVLLAGATGSVAIEVTTFRGEGAYSDGRHPDRVEFVSDLVEDLRRRDFTINAVALDPVDLRLEDPFDGQGDLAVRMIRAVGDPRERFGEDGLRVMRAIRFAAQLGFTVDAGTEEAIPGALPVLARVSRERVRDELLKLLGSSRPDVGLRLLERTGVLGAILPPLAATVGLRQNRFHEHDVWEHIVAAVAAAEGDAVLRLAVLLHDVGKPATAEPRDDSPDENRFHMHEIVGARIAEEICRDLRLSNRDRERVVALVRHHMFWYTPDWSDGSVRRFVHRVGLERLPDLFAVRAADIRSRGRGEDPAVEIDALRRRVAAEIEAASALRVTDLAVGGREVMGALGCAPGPIVGRVLDRLLELVLEDPSLNNAERLLSLVPEIARGLSGGSG